MPVRELMGEMLLELNQPGAALAEFERETATKPNRYRAIANAGRAANLSGDTQVARTMAEQPLVLTKKRDTGRPEMIQAEKLLRNWTAMTEGLSAAAVPLRLCGGDSSDRGPQSQL